MLKEIRTPNTNNHRCPKADLAQFKNLIFQSFNPKKKYSLLVKVYFTAGKTGFQ